jgi:prepilin-type N-terminal cleavage/methylation domain-containing protein
MRKKAFTLAEVLITIGIVGVVSALTIPTLQTAYKARKLRTQFNKSLSTLQQVLLKMQDEGESLDSTYAHGEFYKVFAKYLNVAADCGMAGREKTSAACFPQDHSASYKTLDQKGSQYALFDDGELVLQDGTNLLFENIYAQSIILISVDLNGYLNPPNIWGYDLFTFQLIDGKILPAGDPKTSYKDSKYCNLNTTSDINGITCAKEAQSNTEYFKWVVKNVK